MSIKSKRDYKHTVHLPQTSFPMKANLPESEPKRLRLWKEESLYEGIRKRSSGRKKFILHDGPPYANGNIHIGHALNKILKDIIVKYKTMRGFDALYVPGWDCHGLPIEHQCLKEMGKRKEEVERVQFRKQARRYAERFIEIQREEFKRLGVFGEWDKPYRTMDFDYQATITESFLTLYEKGFIEQRLKPVPWCYDCETALADAELEYEDRNDSSVYVAFRLDPSSCDPAFKHFVAKDPASVLIWTTTPWTLPANVGMAFHPKLHYVLAQADQNLFVFAEELQANLQNKLGWKQIKVVAKFSGETVPFKDAAHPFINRRSKRILADYVSSTDGTGVVHIAPGHGEEDYQYGHLENSLPIVSPVDEKGRFTKEFPECAGVNVFKANKTIIELLRKGNALVHEENYTHSYPHCWRCKNAIIFRATNQWFMKIDHNNLRKEMLKAIQSQIVFTPDWGKNRIGSMVETRPEWCLSRQRYWGVPIPIISCQSCKRILVPEAKKAIVQAFQEKGADVWFEKDPLDFLGGKKPSCCQKPELAKETDIIDVWFDSGVSHQAILKKNRNLSYPADLYLEGSDQHRGWFQSALTTAIALDGQTPFRGVLTHGFVVDGEGKKMSKSAGNVVAPQDVMKEFGADILRLWVASCDYQFDVRLSKDILKQSADSYRKIRNTFRYLLGNLNDYDRKSDKSSLNDLHPLDQWAVTRADLLLSRAVQSYDRYEFHIASQVLYDFCAIDLSSYYFDILKDTLYTARRDSFLRRSAQRGLFEILARLVRAFAPILSFTMDEVWKSLPIEESVPSVHESELKVAEPVFISKTYEEWEKIRLIRDAIMPSLERKRVSGLIGSSLDAKVYLRTNDPHFVATLKANLKELRRVFIVSQVDWMDQDRREMEEVAFRSQPAVQQSKLYLSVEKADGSKCERCWNYSVQVGSFPDHPTLCERCVEAV